MTPAHTPASAPARPPGLRERKKLKTRLAIRAAAYDLIRERGYEATGVERIAERAEVSPSTVLRYFPTKEDIVLWDEYEPLVEELLAHRPAGEPLSEALRRALHRATALTLGENPHFGRDDMLLRVRLVAEVPAVRARLMESMSGTGRLMCRALAGRTGRDASDLEVRIYAMGLMGALLETVVYWVEQGCRDDLTLLTDRALAVFRDLPETRRA
jgi:AcrR family transcriptional regulator